MDFASFNYLYVLLMVIFATEATRPVGDCKIGHVRKRLFSDAIVNHIIVGPVMSAIKTENQDECEMECHLAVPDLCYMFNYHPSSKVCELLRFRNSANLYKVEKKDGSTLKTRKCESNPCIPSKSCVALGNQTNTLCLNFTGRIIKANMVPVCIEGQNDGYGKFFAPADGKIKTVKLVHTSGGYTSYGRGSGGSLGNWGTRNSRDPHPHFELHLTDAQNSRISPPPGYPLDNKWDMRRYGVPGFTVMSPEFEFPEISPPLAVTKGKEFRIWVGQDLVDFAESDNRGKTCGNVYVLYSG